MGAPKNLMSAGQVPKDVRKLLKELAADGFDVELCGGGHFRVTAPNTDSVIISASPRNPDLTLRKLRTFRTRVSA